MAVRKIAISVPEDVLKQVDRLAKKRKTTRSAFITRLLKEVSRASQERDMIAQINQLFEDQQLGDEQVATARFFLQSTKETDEGSEW